MNDVFEQTQEEKSEHFWDDTIVDMAQEYATHYIVTHYEDPEHPESMLDYHNTAHTLDVIRRTRHLMQALQASTHDLQLALIAAAFHDVIQLWDKALTIQSGIPVVLRKRSNGKSEKASIDLARQWMLSRVEDKPKYGTDDFNMVKQAICGTIAVFDPAYGAVTQPYVWQGSYIITKVLALADIGGAAIDGPEHFAQEGDQIFRESHVRFVENIGLEKLRSDPALQKLVHAYILDWMNKQQRFVDARIALHPHYINSFSLDVRPAIEASMPHLQSSLAYIQQLTKIRSKMGLLELLTEMGFAFDEE